MARRQAGVDISNRSHKAGYERTVEFCRRCTNDGAFAQSFEGAGFTDIRSERLEVALVYASDDDALGAAFRGGPVALAYNRFDDATKQAVHAEYLRSIAAYRIGEGYRIPGEFVVTVGVKPTLA